MIAVFIAIVAAMLVTLMGLALDTARVKYTVQQLQSAADAAALAAAGQVTSDDAATQFPVTRAAAVNIAAANEAATAAVAVDSNLSNDPAGDVVVGVWERYTDVFTPGTVRANAVKVSARRTVGSTGGQLPLLFGAVFGQPLSDVSRSAIAFHGSVNGPAAILVLDPDKEYALELKGNPRLNAPNGRVHVNSSDSCGIHLTGSPGVPRLMAGRITVRGGYCVPSGASDPIPIPNADWEDDPLEGLPYPDTTTMTDHGSITSSGTYDPGYYPAGVDFNGGVAFLNPGVYVFGAHGIDLHGDAMIEGNEIMLFLELDARVVTSGSTSGLNISAPTSGVYEGISIFAHRDSWLNFDISGLGVFEVLGTMYMKRGHLEMDGNVDRRIGRIIINTQLLRGNGRYMITGEGPPEAGPFPTFLVK